MGIYTYQLGDSGYLWGEGRKGNLLGGYLHAFLFFRKRTRATKANTKQKQIFGVPDHSKISLRTH